MKKIFRNLEGLSLIESVVTIGIVLLLATGLVVGMNSSLANARRSSYRVKATEYAVDAIERLRKERDLSWSAFVLLAGTKCMDENGVLTPLNVTCPMDIDTVYSRRVELTYTSSDGVEKMDITVVVSFVENNETKSEKSAT